MFRRDEVHLDVIVHEQLDRQPARLDTERLAYLSFDDDLAFVSYAVCHRITPHQQYNLRGNARQKLRDPAWCGTGGM
jgi:hypothetical protein